MSANTQEAGRWEPGLSGREESPHQTAQLDSSSAVLPMYNNPRLSAALEYAGMGFRVLPVSSDGESIPKITDWPNRATSDLAQIIEWWTEWPNANVAVLTGGSGGLKVVDVDVKNDPQGVEGYASLLAFELAHPEVDWSGAVRAVTPSGGMHLYYRDDAAVASVIGVLPSVDLLADKRFVVVPPSSKIINGYERSYHFTSGDFRSLQPTPDGLLAAFNTTARAIHHALGQGGSGAHGPVSDLDLSRLLKEGFRAGERDNGFYRLACKLFRKYWDNPQWIEAVMADVWRATDQPQGDFLGWSLVKQKMASARSFIENERRKETEALAALQKGERS